MRKKLLFGLMLCFSSVFAKNIYVAKNGNDNNNGTENQPYLTIQKAAQVAEAGDIVYIKQGIYRETVTPSNNGTNGNPILFQAFEDDEVTISAVELVSNWTVHSGNIYKAQETMSLNTLNMLYYNGVAMDIARWPNNSDNNRYTIDANPITSGSASHIDAPNILDIDWSGGYIWYLGAHSGASWTRPITNSSSSRVDFTAVDISKWPFNPHNPTVFRNGNRGRFYLFNALGALDYEREWYYNNNEIYFNAPNNANPNNAIVEYAAREKTINITKNYIHFDGINAFGGKVYVKGKFATIKNGIFKHCLETLDDLNNTSAQIGNGAFDVLGDNTTIENNIIEYGSANGIVVKGYSGGQNSVIQNNIIRHFNTIGNHSSLIRSTADNVTVVNNTCYSTGRDGLYINANNCEVGYNDVYEVMKINNDGGVFYVVGNENLKNTEVHHNWFHDSDGPDYADGRCAGIYLDNDSKGYEVHHNVVWNVTWTGIQTNWDVWDNEIYNNTLWNVEEAMGAWLPNRNGYQTTIQRTKIYNNYASEKDWLGTDEQNNIIDHNNLFEDIDNHDFTPTAGSSLIDAGKIILGITDGHIGSAPDIGAYERGGVYWTPGAYLPQFCSLTWYLDEDNDGFGDINHFIEACNQPQGYAAVSGDLCPQDSTKTSSGNCGCGVREGSCTDEVSFSQNITTIPSLKDIQVDLNYIASEQRDLVLVLLDGNGAWVGNHIVTVEAGSGTQRMNMLLTNAPTIGPSYRLDAYVRPVGGDYTTNIISDTKNIAVVASGIKDCAGVVDGTAIVDGCGVCSGGSTNILPKYDSCSTVNETIAFATAYTTIQSTTTIDVNVVYTSALERDIVVLLNAPDGTWLGNGVTTVPAGSGNKTITINLIEPPIPGIDYKLGATLREVGTGWEGNIDSKQVLIEITGVITGIGSTQQSLLNLYPNPTTGQVHIINTFDYEVYNSMGQLIISSNKTSFNISSFPSGVYYLTTGGKSLKIFKE